MCQVTVLSEGSCVHYISASARYQFNPAYFQTQVTSQILLKALTNLPHTDFTLCKCMIDQTHVFFWCCFICC